MYARVRCLSTVCVTGFYLNAQYTKTQMGEIAILAKRTFYPKHSTTVQGTGAECFSQKPKTESNEYLLRYQVPS